MDCAGLLHFLGWCSQFEGVVSRHGVLWGRGGVALGRVECVGLVIVGVGWGIGWGVGWGFGGGGWWGGLTSGGGTT